MLQTQITPHWRAGSLTVEELIRNRVIKVIVDPTDGEDSLLAKEHKEAGLTVDQPLMNTQLTALDQKTIAFHQPNALTLYKAGLLKLLQSFETDNTIVQDTIARLANPSLKSTFSCELNPDGTPSNKYCIYLHA
jgi:hypothetical protein